MRLLEGGALFFQSFPYSGAHIEVLRAVMIFKVAVGVAEIINISYTITACSHVQFMWALDTRFCITNKFQSDYDIKNLIVMQKLYYPSEVRTAALKPTVAK